MVNNSINIDVKPTYPRINPWKENPTDKKAK
jgi:hypothetical protein